MTQFKTVHVPIMGFTQDQSKESGLEKVWRDLLEIVPDEELLIHPQKWDGDFKGLAEFIFRNGTQKVTVKVYAYSWGCGHGFIRLAKLLRRRGIQIPNAVLCDPVFHSVWRRCRHSEQRGS